MSIRVKEKGIDAEKAWFKAAEEIIASRSSREKSCPRGAFLGLFSTCNGLNAAYAKRAIEILRTYFSKGFTATALWKAIGNLDKSHNQQMDVVLSLWDKGYIKLTDCLKVQAQPEVSVMPLSYLFSIWFFNNYDI